MKSRALALGVLKTRYASGEINRAEYEEAKKVIMDSPREEVTGGRIACANCGLVKHGSFQRSLSTLREANETSNCCDRPTFIFYRGLGYQYKEDFKKNEEVKA